MSEYNARLTAAVLGIIALFVACQMTEAFRALHPPYCHDTY